MTLNFIRLPDDAPRPPRAANGSPDSADLLYGVKAIGQFLGLTRPQAQHRIDEGTIPTFRMGSTICARRTSLRTWLAECERGGR